MRCAITDVHMCILCLHCYDSINMLEIKCHYSFLKNGKRCSRIPPRGDLSQYASSEQCLTCIISYITQLTIYLTLPILRQYADVVQDGPN